MMYRSEMLGPGIGRWAFEYRWDVGPLIRLSYRTSCPRLICRHPLPEGIGFYTNRRLGIANDAAHGGQSLSGTLRMALPCSHSSGANGNVRSTARRASFRERRVNRPRHATLSRFARESGAAHPWPARASRCASPCRFFTAFSTSYELCRLPVPRGARESAGMTKEFQQSFENAGVNPSSQTMLNT
jgi:hypothetical protein